MTQEQWALVLSYLPHVRKVAYKVAKRSHRPIDKHLIEEKALDFTIESVLCLSSEDRLETELVKFIGRRMTRSFQTSPKDPVQVDVPLDRMPDWKHQNETVEDILEGLTDLLDAYDRGLLKRVMYKRDGQSLKDVLPSPQQQSRWHDKVKPVLRKWAIRQGLMEGLDV